MTSVGAPAAAASAGPLARLGGARHRVALAGVLVLSACLNLVALSQNGWANTYYSAAVRSMLRSWSNFAFVSFDPGGMETVDKPPLALWVQAASAKAFGYSGMSMLVPQAVAGVLAVLFLYLLVARYLGRVAGLVAALVLAVSPVSVAVNRDNNPDAIFTLLLVVAAWAGARAVESGKLRWLLGCAVAVGLAFETKMLAAAVVVPALALAYLLLAPRPVGRRLLHLLAAGGVMVVVAGAWIAAVALTPAADRPWISGTSDNSALSLAFGYNGLGRVDGQQGGTSFGGGLGGAFSGAPGVFRLLNGALGDQVSWLLPLAVVGGLAALWLAWRARERARLGALVVLGGWFVTAAAVFSLASGIVHTYYTSALAPALAGLVGAGVVALAAMTRRGGWWILPAVVALATTAALEVVLVRRSGYLSWIEWLVAAGTAVAAVLLVVASRTRVRGRAALGALAVGVGILLVAPAAWSESTLESPVNGVFPGAGPSFVDGLAATGGRGGFFARGGFGGPGAFRGGGPGGFRAGGQVPQLPGLPGGGAGSPPPLPGLPGGGGPGGFRGGGLGGPGGPFGGGDASSALAYVRSHGAASRFPLVVTGATSAASAIIGGTRLASIGGFSGRESSESAAFLAALVERGDARYFLLGGGGFGGRLPGDNRADQGIAAIQTACRAVPAVSGLYDCAGRAPAIRRAG